MAVEIPSIGRSARWLMTAGVLIALGGMTPLLLYTVFGATTGTVLWPGILTVVAVPIGFLLLGIGVLKLLVARMQER